MAQLRAPENVQVTQIPKSSHVKVTWQRPDHGATPVSYSFRVLRRKQGQGNFKIVFSEKDTCEYIATDTRPGTCYEFYVQSFGVRGDGPATNPITFRTREEAPVSPPENLHALEVMMDEILVTWEPPRDCACVITGYRLFYDQEAFDDYAEVVLPATALQYRATRLYRKTVYRFQVLAISEGGEGPLSDILTQPTLTDPASRWNPSDQVKTSAPVKQLASGSRASESSSDSPPKSAGPRTSLPAAHGVTIASPPARAAQLPLSPGYEEQAPRIARGFGAALVAPSAGSRVSQRPASPDDDVPAPRLARGFGAALVAPAPAPTVALVSPVQVKTATPWGPRLSDLPTPQPAPNRTHVLKRSPLENWQARRDAADRHVVGCSSTDGEPTDEAQEEAEFVASRFSLFAPAPPPSHTLQIQAPAPGAQFNRGNKTVKSVPAPPEKHEPRRAKLQDNLPLQSVEREQSGEKKQVETGRTVSRGVDLPRNPPPVIAEPLEFISSGKATIRGKKNAVRKTLEILTGADKFSQDPNVQKLYDEEKDGKIVIYLTSMRAIRDTFASCERVQRIFHNLRLKVSMRDITLQPEYADELELRRPGAKIPQVFVNGQYFGDEARIVELNEQSQLASLLANFEERPSQDCSTCGGAGFVPCTWCQGSKKSIENPFETLPGRAALRCTVCNVNGLQRCSDC